MKIELKIREYLLAAFLLIMPFVMKLTEVKLTSQESEYFVSRQGISYDVFLHLKAEFIIGLSLVFLLYSLVNIGLKKTSFKKKELILLGLLAASFLLAFIFSKHKTEALFGSPSEYEGLLILISYIAIFLFASIVLTEERARVLLRRTITALALISSILGYYEYLAGSLMKHDFFINLVSNDSNQDNLSRVVHLTYSMVSLTFYNPNYLAGFILIIFPWVFLSAFCLKNKFEAVINLIASFGLISVMLFTSSTTGLYLTLAEAAFISFIAVKKGHKRELLVRGGIAVGLILIGFIAVNVKTKGKLMKGFSYSLVNRSDINTAQADGKLFKVNNVVFENGDIKLVGQTDSLIIKNVSRTLYFRDQNDNKIKAYHDNEKKIALDDKRFSMIRIYVNNQSQVVVDLGYDKPIKFYSSGTRFYGVGQNGAKIEDVSIPDSSERLTNALRPAYKFLSGRGFIWANSWKVIKSSPLIGHGAGNYQYYFKQYNYADLLNTFGSNGHIVDKPHSMYLQLISSNGLLAFVIFIIIVVNLIKEAIKKASKWTRASQKSLDFGLICALVAFIAWLIYSLINDSMITVTPYACIMAGLIKAFRMGQDDRIGKNERMTHDKMGQNRMSQEDRISQPEERKSAEK